MMQCSRMTASTTCYSSVANGSNHSCDAPFVSDTVQILLCVFVCVCVCACGCVCVHACMRGLLYYVLYSCSSCTRQGCIHWQNAHVQFIGYTIIEQKIYGLFLSCRLLMRLLLSLCTSSTRLVFIIMICSCDHMTSHDYS